jgi:hypothetical protein
MHQARIPNRPSSATDTQNRIRSKIGAILGLLGEFSEIFVHGFPLTLLLLAALEELLLPLIRQQKPLELGLLGGVEVAEV